MIKLTFTPDVVAAADIVPGSLLVAIRKLHAAVPIAEVLIDLKDEPTRKYLYRITTAEGPARVWKQFLRFDEGKVRMSFDVVDWWQDFEFIPHREVREIAVAILQTYPSLTTIKYEVV